VPRANPLAATDREGRPRGNAYVRFPSVQDAEAAMAQLEDEPLTFGERTARAEYRRQNPPAPRVHYVNFAGDAGDVRQLVLERVPELDATSITEVFVRASPCLHAPPRAPC
jgi:hypothetical protein